MMRHLKALAILLCILVLAVGVSSFALSQGTGAAGDISCDSDLVLLWYVADRFFAFNAVQTALVQTAPPASILDLNRFNRGQYAPLFDALNANRDPNTGDIPGRVITPEFLSMTSIVITMDDAAFQNFVGSMQSIAGVPVPLVPAAIPGEAAECGLLRTQLQRFFAAVSLQDVQTGFALGDGVNTNFNGNLNANLNGNTNTNGNLNANTNANTNTNINTNTNVNTNTNTNVNSNDNSGGSGGNNNGNDNGGGGGGSGDDDDGGGNSGPGGGGGNDNGGGGGGGGDNDDDG